MRSSSLALRRVPSRSTSRRHAAILGGAAVVATAGFAAIARATARGRTAELDEALRSRLAVPEGRPGRRVAHGLAAPGKWWAYLPAALGVAAYLLRAPQPAARGAASLRERLALGAERPQRVQRSRRAGAGAVVAASALAAVLGPACDRWLAQPPAPPGHPNPRAPVFPSGHAFGPATLALASAYVLARESLVHPAVVVPVALAYPLVSAGGKLVEERHWASDVVGGYLGAVAVAAACLTAYELADG